MIPRVSVGMATCRLRGWLHSLSTKLSAMMDCCVLDVESAGTQRSSAVIICRPRCCPRVLAKKVVNVKRC